jgi:carboxylesterase
MAGGEPYYYPGGPIGCLLVHGFTASPQELHGLGEHLAGEGHAVLGVRLFAHATKIDDMLRARWTDWYASVEDGYHLLRGACDQIVVMGLSLGAVLAFLLAADHPLTGVVAMSAPFAPRLDPRLRLARLVKGVVRFIPKGPPDWRDPEAAKTRVAYGAYPLRALAEVPKAMDTMRAILPRVIVPVLLIHSMEDDFVPPENMERIHAALGSRDKQTLLVENSSHVISLDFARRQVYAAAAEFVRRVGAGG